MQAGKGPDPLTTSSRELTRRWLRALATIAGTLTALAMCALTSVPASASSSQPAASAMSYAAAGGGELVAATTPTCTGTTFVHGAHTGDPLDVILVPTVGNGSGNWHCLLTEGDDNSAVARLQLGMDDCDRIAGVVTVFSPPLAVDGDFGPKTESALVKVQAFWGVPDDGVYGPVTAVAMDWPVRDSGGGACDHIG